MQVQVRHVRNCKWPPAPHAQGNMPALLSHYRPDHPIYAFVEDRAVQRRLALYHGVTAIHTPFGETADESITRCGAGFMGLM